MIYKNNATGKETILLLNTATCNFLEGIYYNYISSNPLNKLGN
jgi:hypothetical protein